MKRLQYILLFSLIPFLSFGQKNDSSIYLGKLSGQWRNYYLSTFNEGNLKDFHALASGGFLKYEYKLNKYFKIGAAAYTSYNLGIQDLTIPDPTTNKLSRYEAGLFDVQDLTDRFILFPGELYMNFNVDNHDFTIGRMKLKSPLLNPQDGRMIPTLEQGILYKFHQKKWQTQLGVFNAIAPRSTAGYFGIGESIGKYPVGRQLNGKVSAYAGNTNSSYLAIANLKAEVSQQLSIDFWNYYVDNVFNSIYLKPSYKLANTDFTLRAEWLLQTKVGEGGNAVDSLRYFSHASSNLLGIQIEKKTLHGKWSVAYNRILPGGRFLFPREWGREFLFSFQKRERSEGSANNHAIVAYFEHNFEWKNQQLKTISSIGHHWKPALTNAEENKYAQPDYTHINLDLFYSHAQLKGFKPELLLTYKLHSKDDLENPNFILNKVNMFQINAIINYNF